MKLFCYGTLKKGFGNHGILKDAEYLGKAVIDGKMYSMGAFPYVDITKKGFVEGEVYKINPQILAKCDTLEGYPHFYNRTLVDAMFYVYHMKHTDECYEEIEDGVWE